MNNLNWRPPRWLASRSQSAPGVSFAPIAATLVLLLAAAARLPSTAQSVKATPGARDHPVSFQRDIRPLLSNICSACHGPDEKARKAGLRLDTREGVLKTIVPLKPLQSALYLRLKDTGPGRMPPAGFLRQPTPQQIELVERWIAQGGKWEQHWAYAPIAKPVTPAAPAPLRPANEIDRFVLARLGRERITPSAPADRRTLLRRLSFDLTGLPPSYEEVQRFLADTTPGAYEKEVERLLNSDHFGERLAVTWLDLVRYADTRGYHGDQHQDVSPYRDYVIHAFNANMPFDRFTREQLAGDLLPNATIEQKIASGYNKLLMTTEEGGAQPKEYMAKYAADRVRNVSAVWLGSTMGCCQCHDHKYDPFTIRDFYSMAAFFADVKQTPVGGLDITPLPTPAEASTSADLAARIAALQKRLDTATDALAAEQSTWERNDSAVQKAAEPIRQIVATEPANRTDSQRRDLAAYFRSIAPSLASDREERGRLQAQLDTLNVRIRKTMITTAVEPVVMRVLPRGNWLDESGPVVTPAVPTFLDQLDTPGRRANRLDLAEWLTSPRNPLLARVMVNRFWALLFGRGLSRSLEDFGAQGAPPTHPELLDWLAADYREHGWDTKRIIKQIVMSATYRESSVPTPEQIRRDPANDLFAHQGRHRLEAEFVRDNALSVSGLLVDRLAGPSVKPYQPARYWEYLNFPIRIWEADKGPDQYRRGLYTYWCRTYLQPSLLAFDAPTREECCSGRTVSNTPQQALVLMNDPTYVEAARALAERVARGGGNDPQSRTRLAYRIALQRDPTPGELQTLLGVYTRNRAAYAADPAAANALLHEGERPPDSAVPPQELAAWTAAARVLLNLHETITRN